MTSGCGPATPGAATARVPVPLRAALPAKTGDAVSVPMPVSATLPAKVTAAAKLIRLAGERDGTGEEGARGEGAGAAQCRRGLGDRRADDDSRVGAGGRHGIVLPGAQHERDRAADSGCR